MDSEVVGWLVFFMVSAGIFLFFIASVTALNDKTFWGPRCLNTGAGLLGFGWILFLFAVVEEEYGSSTLFDTLPYLLVMGSFLIVGVIVATIGLFSFCARYKATFQRMRELDELVAISKQEQESNR